LGTMCTCEEIERGTHACRASQLGPVEGWCTQDGKLGINIQDPPQSPEDGHTYCISLVRIAFCRVSENLPLRCLFYITMNIYFCFYVNTARDVITVLLILAKYLSLYLHIFTYRGTHTQAHMYNQHTRRMATTRHRSLVGRGGRNALLETLHTHTKIKNVRKNRYSRI